MKKRTRPSFLRHLEERYEDGRPTERGRRRMPPTYVVNVKPAGPAHAKSAAAKGVIDMSVRQFSALAIFFILLACIATSATTFGVIELVGAEGPQGVQGPQGTQGDRGPAGLQGPAGNDASQEMVKRLAALFAVQQTSQISGGADVPFNDSRVSSCVSYVLTGKPDAGACAGFHGSQ